MKQYSTVLLKKGLKGFQVDNLKHIAISYWQKLKS